MRMRPIGELFSVALRHLIRSSTSIYISIPEVYHAFFLPLLLAGALAAPMISPSVSNDDKHPRARRVVVDTAAQRQLAADLVARAKTAAENGSMQEARAHLLTANTMYREAGGLETTAAYSLVHIDYALDRYTEAGDVLTELADDAVKNGDPSAAAYALVDAASLYRLAGRRIQVSSSVMRIRALMKDTRMSEADRASIKKRVG